MNRDLGEILLSAGLECGTMQGIKDETRTKEVRAEIMRVNPMMWGGE